MKAVSLNQPWASLIACGAKRFETRSWPTKHRGLLAIHATARAPDRGMMAARRIRDLVGPAADLPLGAVVAVVRLVEVHHLVASPLDRWLLIQDVFGPGHPEPDLEMAVGDFAHGRFAWELELVSACARPLEARGAQRIWNLPAEWMPIRGGWHHDPAAAGRGRCGM